MLTLGSLFTGIGGIDLAFEQAGWEIKWQVEIDDYATRVLEKHWPHVKRYRDVREVMADAARPVGRAAESRRQRPDKDDAPIGREGEHLPPDTGETGILEPVDCIAGGFPCQDISLAGKGAGLEAGERSGLWFEFARIIGVLRPRAVLLENVPAVASRGGVRVVADLTSMGYDASWGIISAADAGALHLRKRWWCVAYAADSRRQGWLTNQGCRDEAGTSLPHGEDGIVADANDFRGYGCWSRSTGGDESQNSGSTADLFERNGQGGGAWVVADTTRLRQRESHYQAIPQQHRRKARVGLEGGGGRCNEPSPESAMANPNAAGLAVWHRSAEAGRPCTAVAGSDWWSVEPNVGRVADGVPSRVDRLRGLGNAVVPQVVYPIAVELKNFLE